MTTLDTPAYFYDIDLLQHTLRQVNDCRGDFYAHYALKANNDPRITRTIAAAGLGADCVSAGEIHAALDAGFAPRTIFFAGVGKTDSEIADALDAGIGCLVAESLQELHVIADIARARSMRAPVAIRVNPHVDAHTDAKITTGLAENKFGIDRTILRDTVAEVLALPDLSFTGLHFHIGSQITSPAPFAELARQASAITRDLIAAGVRISMLDLGGGLGIDYTDPLSHPVADFATYFDTLRRNLDIPRGISLHVEPGRSIVAQCGALISRVLYIKQGLSRQFAIIDAGLNNLIRPALYGATHSIINLSATDNPARPAVRYDVVGPICESSDIFATGITLPELRRGDLVAILSAGAYCQCMQSAYNMRPQATVIYSDDYSDKPRIPLLTNWIQHK